VGLAFVLIAFVWNIVIQIGVMLVGVVIFIYSGEKIDPFDPNTTADLMRADLAGVAFFVAIGGIVAIAALGARLAGFDLRRTFALRSGPLPLLALAAFGTFAVPWMPSWIAEKLLELMPFMRELGTLDLVSRMLTEGPLFGRVLLIIAVTVGAPLFEELLFRGFFWYTAERATSGFLGSVAGLSAPLAAQIGALTAFIGTSIFFALFHLDPVQSISLLPIAFFLGWLRLLSGSVWPGVIAHFVNNALAVVLTLQNASADAASDSGTSGLVAALTGMLLVALCLAALPFRAPIAPPEQAA
jgi:membrane protease YdiL (CAAX protease family)